jgi:hypothetical protein
VYYIVHTPASTSEIHLLINLQTLAYVGLRKDPPVRPVLKIPQHTAVQFVRLARRRWHSLGGVSTPTPSLDSLSPEMPIANHRVCEVGNFVSGPNVNYRDYLYECQSKSCLGDFPGSQPVFIIYYARDYRPDISTSRGNRVSMPISTEHGVTTDQQAFTSHPRNQTCVSCVTVRLSAVVVTYGSDHRQRILRTNICPPPSHPRRSLAAAFSPKCYLYMIPTSLHVGSHTLRHKACVMPY